VQHDLVVLRLICQCNLGHWKDGFKTAELLDPEIWPDKRREKLLIYEQRNTWEKAQLAIYSRFKVREAITLIENSEGKLSKDAVSPWATQKKQLANIINDAKYGVREKVRIPGDYLHIF
jgi:hypothetical protein